MSLLQISPDGLGLPDRNYYYREPDHAVIIYFDLFEGVAVFRQSVIDIQSTHGGRLLLYALMYTRFCLYIRREGLGHLSSYIALSICVLVVSQLYILLYITLYSPCDSCVLFAALHSLSLPLYIYMYISIYIYLQTYIHVHIYILPFSVSSCCSVCFLRFYFVNSFHQRKLNESPENGGAHTLFAQQRSRMCI